MAKQVKHGATPKEVSFLRPPVKQEAYSWQHAFSDTIQSLNTRFENLYNPLDPERSRMIVGWLDGFDVSIQQEVIGRFKEINQVIQNFCATPEAVLENEKVYTYCTTGLHEETISMESLEGKKQKITMGPEKTPTAHVRGHAYMPVLPIKDKDKEKPITGFQVQVKDLPPEQIHFLDTLVTEANEILAKPTLSPTKRDKISRIVSETVEHHPIAQLIVTVDRVTYEPHVVNPASSSGFGRVNRDSLFSISFKRVPNGAFEKDKKDVIKLELTNLKPRTPSDSSDKVIKKLTLPLESINPAFHNSETAITEYEDFLTRIYNSIALHSKTFGPSHARKATSPQI